MEDENETQLTNDVKQRIKTYLQKKYSVSAINELLDKASLLNPRFKATYVDSVSDVKEVLTEEAAEINSMCLEEPQVDAMQKVLDEEPPPKKRKPSQILKKTSAVNSSFSPEEKAKQELLTYLQAPAIGC